MSRLCALAILLLSTSGASAKSRYQDAPVRVIELTGDNIVTVNINGVEARLVVDAAMGSGRGVNPEIATKAELKPSMIGFLTVVGPVFISSRTDNALVDYGMIKRKDRVAFSDRAIVKNADGKIGPAALPYEIVRYRLAPEQAGEKTIALPLGSRGMFGLGTAHSIVKIGKEEVAVTFSLMREPSITPAPTSTLLAAALDGKLAGEASQTLINFEVLRPIRQLVLNKPLVIAGRVVDPLMARISDYGDATTIPDSDAPRDEDEILVQAKKGKKQRHQITLGRSFLKGCSSITYDFKQEKIILRCI